MSDLRTILIVDDSESDRLLCRRYIQKDSENSYRIIEAETISEGIELWRCQQPNVAIVDFNLPDGNGLKFLEAIQEPNQVNSIHSRQVTLEHKLPVIMLTGHEDPRSAVNAMKLGASDYLIKNDINEFSLCRAINSLLERIELSSQLERSQQREALVSQISLNIRQFLNLEDICAAIVQEVRKFLNADRAMIYKFSQEPHGRIIAETLVEPWQSCLKILSEDDYLNLTASHILHYREGKSLITSDIYSANLDQNYLQILEKLQVRAKIVVPILLSEPISNNLSNANHNPSHQQFLWGVIIAHQCAAPRIWEECEIKLFQQLSVQLAIAIQQAEIYQNLQNLNASLERQVQERTAQLQTSEHKTRSLLNSLPDIINLFNAEGDYLESVLNHLEYDLVPPDIDRVGKNITAILPAEIANRQLQAIQKAVVTQEIQILEQTFEKGNQLHHEEVRVVPFQEDSVIVLARDISDRKRNEEKLRLQYQRTQLVAEVTLKIRQSLNIDEILQTTVTEVKKILQADRILILELHDDGSTNVLKEACAEGLMSLVGKHIDKPCFYDEYAEHYRLGNFIKIDNIDTDTNITKDHADFLRQLAVKSHLTVPILQSQNVWGLIIVDQCDHHRQWTEFEIEFIQQLANQVAIAIIQSQLLKSLQKSEEQRRLAVDLNHIGCWDFDVKTGKAEWNDNHFRLMGLDPNDCEGSYSTWQDRLHPDDAEWVEQAFAQALETHTELNVEYRVVHPQGDLYWVLTKGQGVYDVAGHPTRMIGVMLDISDRKHIEIALENELLRNKTLVNTSFDGIFALDGEGNVIESNPSFAIMLGYPLEEITQLSIYDIDIRWTREELSRGIQEFKLGKRAKFETQYRKQDGSICHVEISANSVAWDNTISQFCICRDITQRKLAEASLLKSVEREQMLNQFIQTIRGSLDLEVVFKSAVTAISNLLNLDQSGIVQYIAERKVWRYIAIFRDHPELIDSIGLEIADEDNPIATRLKQLEIVQINDTNQIEDAINRELAQRKFGAWLLVPIVVNEQVWGSLSLRIAHKINLWEDTEIEIAQVIANQIAIAIQQVKLYQQLELELAERRQTEINLAKAKELAESASKAKSEFLANMSHEIRTPMNGVLGMAQLLANTPLNKEQQDFVQTMLDSGDLLLTVINDILDFSKIESGKLQLEAKEFDFTHTINSVCNLLSKQAFDKNINFQCHINYDVPPIVIGDSLRLRQILVNLIGNAIKFTEEGSVSIRFGGKFLTPSTYEFRFAILDTGIGINGDRINKLFRPFTQADASINRQFGGTGLGLAICKRLIELMGGTIWVESRGNIGGEPPSDWVMESSSSNTQGSTFYFAIALPVAHPQQVINNSQVIKPTELTIHAQQFPIKILIVEDNILNQKIALLMLQKLGYQADVVNNGSESVAAMLNQESEQAYDLIFMDVQMPVMDGLTATRVIRENLLSKTKPWIIALTADALPEDCQACIEAGMNDYISKPVSIKALARSLSEYVKANVYFC